MNDSATGTFRALFCFNYRIWAVGALISNIGTWIQRVAQDWFVLTCLTNHDATILGIIMGLQFAPQLLLLPWAGPAADRFNQRKLLMFTQATMGILAMMLGILTLAGATRLWHMYLFAFLFGCASAIDSPVRQTFVAELVGDEHLSNAVALNSSSFNIARMVGPAVAGLLIAKVGIGSAFLLNGISFIAVLISMVFLRVSELHSNARARNKADGFMKGVQYVRDRADLTSIMIMLFLIGTFGLNFPLFISTMAIKVFHSDAQGFGLLSSLSEVGTLSGALLAASRKKPRFGSIVAGAVVFGIGCTLAALSPGYWWFAGSLVLIGIGALTFTNSAICILQLTSESGVRGRVMALGLAVALGGTAIGAPIVGWIANQYGPRWALVVGAIAGFAAAIVGIAFLKQPSERASDFGQ
ncbi:MAG: MFS transporter [Cyanobacteria bacterium SZAS LIN-3]|nr:MFS transporter [Cyanobacteria bacterium SZAS LIN-3]